MESNTNSSSTPGQEPTLMKKISNTISSLMPGSKSATQSATQSVTKSATPIKVLLLIKIILFLKKL